MTFSYAGRTPDGRRVRGSIEASSRSAAALHLHGRSVCVTQLESVTSATGGLRTFAPLRRPSRARGTFFRSFATLVGAGVSLRAALAALLRQSDGAFAQTLRSIASEVEAGTALSAAMALHPASFSNVVVAIVRAGEVGGSLDDALCVIADWEDRERHVRRRVASALAYPAVVSLVAFGLTTFLLADTMPSFAAMFASMHVALPPVTRLLVALGHLLRTPLPWAVGGAAAFGAALAVRRFQRSQAPWALTADRVRLHLPLVGPIVVKSAVARFSRTFGSLLRAGVGVSAALDACADVVPSQVYRRGLRDIGDALKRGETLTAPFEASGLFDPTFLQLLQTGEESGSVDAMLLRLAAHYDADVDAMLTGLTAIMEPFLICALGATIGTIVASILIPLYSMIGNIQ